MRVQPHAIKVGKFMVLATKTGTEETQVCRYWDKFENALGDIADLYSKNPDSGCVYSVIEVQAVASAPIVPMIKTKLTEKL